MRFSFNGKRNPYQKRKAMKRNYNLDENDYDTIDKHWDAEANEKYGVDFNGLWYKNENDERD